MSLESASYISGLNASNPPAGDPVANAADHLRLIKGVLQNTFPNLTAAVSPSSQQINSNLMPVGGIIMWSGTVATIPTGWGLCNGTTYTRLDGAGTLVSPNLVSRFILGADDSSVTTGTTGGSATHTHTFTDNGTGLTVAQIPSHNHAGGDSGHGHSDAGHVHSTPGAPSGAAFLGFTGGSTGVYVPNTSGSTTSTGYANIQTGYANVWIGYTGSGAAHSHSGTTNATSTLPSYFALAYIIKF